MSVFHLLGIAMLEGLHDTAEMLAGFAACIAAVAAAITFVDRTYFKPKKEQLIAARVWLLAAKERAGRPDFAARAVPNFDALPEHVQSGLMAVELVALQAHDAARYGIEETTDFDKIHAQIADMHWRHSQDRNANASALPLVLEDMRARHTKEWNDMKERHEIIRAIINRPLFTSLTKRAREWAEVMLGVVDDSLGWWAPSKKAVKSRVDAMLASKPASNIP